MGVKKFAFCSCFFEKNIFIKSWNAHVTFKNEEQFLTDYDGTSNLALALEEAKNEVIRRQKSKFQSSTRREAIRLKYSPKVFTPDFDFGTNIFEDGFRKLKEKIDGVAWNVSRPQEGGC